MHWTTLTSLAGAGYLAVFLQAYFGGFRHLSGAQIDLIPGLVVYAGLTYGLTTLVFVSAFAGLLLDSLSANSLGVSVLPLLLIGVLVYRYRDLLLRDQVYAQFVLGMVASAAAPILTLAMILGTGHKPLVGWASLWQLAVMTLAGGCFTPVWFVIFRRFDHAFRYQTVSETSFRSDRQIERGRR